MVGSGTSLHAERPEQPDVQECLIPCFVFAGLDVRRKRFTNVGACCATVDRFVSIPVWPMPDPFAAFATASFPTKSNLLIICDFSLAHSALLAMPCAFLCDA